MDKKLSCDNQYRSSHICVFVNTVVSSIAQSRMNVKSYVCGQRVPCLVCVCISFGAWPGVF